MATVTTIYRPFLVDKTTVDRKFSQPLPAPCALSGEYDTISQGAYDDLHKTIGREIPHNILKKGERYIANTIFSCTITAGGLPPCLLVRIASL